MILQTRNWTHLLWNEIQTKHKLNMEQMNFIAFYGLQIKIGKIINWIINTALYFLRNKNSSQVLNWSPFQWLPSFSILYFKRR